MLLSNGSLQSSKIMGIVEEGLRENISGSIAVTVHTWRNPLRPYNSVNKILTPSVQSFRGKGKAANNSVTSWLSQEEKVIVKLSKLTYFFEKSISVTV